MMESKEVPIPLFGSSSVSEWNGKNYKFIVSIFPILQNPRVNDQNVIRCSIPYPVIPN